MRLCFTVAPEQDGRRLDRFLRAQGLSAGLVRAVKQNGGFFADGAPLHTDQPVHTGQRIAFTLPPEPPTAVTPQPAALTVLYRDAFAAVVDKPAGLAVHPTLNYPDHTLANAWLWYLQTNGESGVFRPVNRLDKNTSGLVLLALNAYAAPLLAQSAQKLYLAVAEGELPPGPGSIEAPLGRRGDSIIGRCVRADGKPSRTDYTVLAAAGGHSLVACLPRTGRTHQIRVHFAYIGHPLAGDDLYGGGTKRIARHALHCARLVFTPPLSTAPVTQDSPLPDDMAALCGACGLSLPAALPL